MVESYLFPQSKKTQRNSLFNNSTKQTTNTLHSSIKLIMNSTESMTNFGNNISDISPTSSNETEKFPGIHNTKQRKGMQQIIHDFIQYSKCHIWTIWDPVRSSGGFFKVPFIASMFFFLKDVTHQPNTSSKQNVHKTLGVHFFQTNPTLFFDKKWIPNKSFKPSFNFGSPQVEKVNRSAPRN